jgi:hypothetical protein
VGLRISSPNVYIIQSGKSGRLKKSIYEKVTLKRLHAHVFYETPARSEETPNMDPNENRVIHFLPFEKRSPILHSIKG